MSSMAGGGGGAAHSVGGVAAAPPEVRQTPTDYTYTDRSGKTHFISLCGLNQDTRLVLRGSGSGGKLFQDVEAILGPTGVQLGRAARGNTDVYINCVPMPSDKRDRDSLNESFSKIIKDNSGVVVYQEHALGYAKALFQRYEIMVSKSEWEAPSQATRYRKIVKKSDDKRAAAKKAAGKAKEEH